MQRWNKLPRLKLAEAVWLPAILVLVAFTRLALSVLPFPWLRKALDRWKALRVSWLARLFSRLPRERITWMVKTAARFVPGATCLTQALATELLYGCCGEAVETRFGVSRQAGRLEAHAWVESGGKVILGAAEAGKFTPLLH